MSLFRSALKIFGQDTLVSSLMFAAGIVLARYFGPDQLGLLYVFLMVASYTEKFGRLGMMDHAAVYYLGQKKYSLAETTRHLTMIALGDAVFHGLLLYLARNPFYHHFVKVSNVPGSYLWIVIATIPFTYLTISFNKLLLADEKSSVYNLSQLVKTFVYLIIITLVLWRKLNISYALVAILLSTVSSTIVSGVPLHPFRDFTFSLNRQMLKDFFSYGWRIYACSLVIFLHQRVDLLVVAKYLTPADVSFYSLAVTANQIIWKISDAFSLVLFPEISKQTQAGSGRATAQVCRCVLPIFIVYGVVLLFLLYPAVWVVYGKAYLPLVTPALFLIPGCIAMALTRILYAHFYGLKHPRAIITSTAPWAVLNLVLNLVLAPRYGISVVAAISSFTYTVSFGFMAFEFVKISGIPLKDLLIPKKEDLERIIRGFRLLPFVGNMMPREEVIG